MKKTLAIITAFLMLLAVVPVSARFEASDTAAHVRLGGYIVGNRNGAALYEWMGFYSDDPENFDIYDSMDISYGAACRGGFVYGFTYGYDTQGTLHSDLYRFSLKDHSVEFINGASAGGEFVFGMAYNSLDDTVYALCNENSPYIASVDLDTGALTRVVTIQQSGAASLGVQTFAIDGQGRFLCLSFSATSAKLVEVNKSTGACTQLLDTGYDTFYAQSMTYCAETNSIFWAHADYSANYKNGLYEISLSDYSITFLGTIGTDFELTCLYTVSGTQPAEGLPGDVNCDGAVTMADLSALSAYMLGKGSLSEQGILNADVNGDGNVNAMDLPLIYELTLRS